MLQGHAIGGVFLEPESKRILSFLNCIQKNAMERQKLEGAGKVELEEAEAGVAKEIERWELEGN